MLLSAALQRKHSHMRKLPHGAWTLAETNEHQGGWAGMTRLLDVRARAEPALQLASSA